GLGWVNVPGQGLYGLGALALGSGGGAKNSGVTKWESHKDGTVDYAGGQTYEDGSKRSFYGSKEPTGSYFQKNPDGTSGVWKETGTKYRFVIEYTNKDGKKY